MEKEKIHADKIYLDLLKNILENGVDRGDRTGTGTRALFGTQMRFDLSDNSFPLLTSKKTAYKSMVYELLWLISGNTNIKYLVDNGVNIWNEWPFKSYLIKNNISVPMVGSDMWNEYMKDFLEKIKNDTSFAIEYGELGPVYGKQWRRWSGEDKDGNKIYIDQLQNAIDQIKKNPESRRIIVSSWNVGEIEEMAKSGLPPCHCFYQFFVSDGKLSLAMYQRSCDMFLGVPFNIASYSLLLIAVAHICNLELGEFIWMGGDTHIYNNHFDQAKQQLSRIDNLPVMPKLKINRKVNNINDFKFEDFELINYNPLEAIKAQISV